MTRVDRPPLRALLALVRQRMGRRAGARLGWVGATVVGLVVLGVGLTDDGAGAAGYRGGLVWQGMRWSLWLGAGPLALSLAAGLAVRDGADGIDALVSIRGGSRSALLSARLLGATIELWARIGLPLWLACLVLFATRSSVVAAPLVVVPIVALGAGVVLAALALGCARYGGGRGRMLLLAVVLLPWLVAEVAGAGVSLPGAFGAVLDAFGADTVLRWGAGG